MTPKQFLGQGDPDADMQLLAGFADRSDGGGKQAGGLGVLSVLAIEKIARVAANIITTGSAAGADPTLSPEGGLDPDIIVR